ncbi:MAG: sigma-70 family RNA polymerase sigma factor [Rhodocyclaceae bacterium]|nr:sigma-70 family RNA polymerase sigma factor [Rhodocyclaceae bacterium]
MPSNRPKDGPSLRTATLFATTHWSVVLAAGHGGSTSASEALSELCRTYWYPLYAYARRTGSSPEDAQDLTQGFFEHLLGSRLLTSADASKGRFRSFLLRSFCNYGVSKHTRAARQKRGGGQTILSLDVAGAETKFAGDLSDTHNPEVLYERNWAGAVLEEAMLQVERQFAASGRGRHFKVLRPLLQNDEAKGAHAAAAKELSTTEATVRVMVHRLRRRYREVLNEVVLRTVDSPNEVEEELRHLLEAVQA